MVVILSCTFPDCACLGGYMLLISMFSLQERHWLHGCSLEKRNKSREQCIDGSNYRGGRVWGEQLLSPPPPTPPLLLRRAIIVSCVTFGHLLALSTCTGILFYVCSLLPFAVVSVLLCSKVTCGWFNDQSSAFRLSTASLTKGQILISDYASPGA